MIKQRATLRNLTDNSRFYVLLSTVCLTVLVVCLTRIFIVDAQVWYIRMEQIFGLLAVMYWYAALLISPLRKLLPTQEWLQGAEFARRAIGVSAACFALLHVVIAVWGQLGGLHGLGLLPTTFRWALWLGLFGLAVLLVMAATSLDAIVDWLCFKHWKLLHRVGYVAGVAVILHIWLVGTHLATATIQLLAFEALVVLFTLESLRLAQALRKNGRGVRMARLAALGLWVGLIVALLVLKAVVPAYNKQHQHTSDGPVAGSGLHAH